MASTKNDKNMQIAEFTSAALQNDPHDPALWRTLTGDLPVRLTNDYLFKGLFQTNRQALIALSSAVLHIPIDEIRSVEILNPIELGATIDAKEYILDLKALLNDDMTINFEMQVLNYHDWPERSLSYLCRLFDNLNHGESYKDTKTAIHIGLLDFSIDDDHNELLASYRILNDKTYQPYTSKFRIYILDLTKESLATNEDCLFHTDIWARFFKAKTWEEIKMLAQKEPAIASAAQTMSELWKQYAVQEQIIAREDRLKREMAVKMELETALNEKDKALNERDKALDERDKALDERDKAQNERDKERERADKAEEEVAQLKELLKRK